MIEGKLIKLRAVEPEDLPKITSLLNDARVSITLGAHYFGISLRAEENWYEHYWKQEYPLSSMTIVNRETGEYMGNCGFNSISWKNRKATIGLFLAPEFWGKGYGIDVMMALCNFGFTQLNLQRIQLYVFAINERGIRLYEKCGFQKEVTLRKHAYVNGEYVDDYIMGVLAEEFAPIYEKYMSR